MLIPQALRTPRLLLRNNQPIILAEASSTVEADASNTSTFTALGYRQTLAPAAKGGKANQNGFRFRNGDMRALARSFRGQVFIGGHEWGDPRARAGDIQDSWAEEMPGDIEMAIYFAILAKAPWAIEGLKNGTIDRFSLGASRGTEITCTVHGVPVWSISECWCFPGETVLDENGDPVVAEWEHDGSRGLELSAVNVPAVDGTSILDSIGIDKSTAILAVGSSAERGALEQMCGRTKPWDSRPAPRAQVAVPEGGSTPASAPITMTSQHEARAIMDRALICKSLGLPATATDEEILARSNSLTHDAAQAGVLRAQLAEVGAREQTLAAERDAAHVESEITRLRASREVGDPVIETLRTAAKTSRASFDSSLALVELSARPVTLAPAAGTAPALQSSATPAVVPGAVTFGADGPDAFEQTRSNANLPILMKGCGVTVDDIRKHGARKFNHEPKLQELVDSTAARGDRMGV